MKTILVVEDETLIAELLEMALDEAGYRVVLARHGLEALECLRRALPDLVLSDLMMPFLDGRGLCKAMQESESYRAVPIILMSAANPPEPGLGHVAFLHKPFDLDRVIQQISQILDG